MTRWLGALGWLGLVALGIALVFGAEQPITATGLSWLAYPLGPGDTLALQLHGGGTVRIQLWLEQPRPWAWDPRATTPVRLGWRALDREGTSLAEGAPWTTARSSWIRPLTLEEPLLPVAAGPDPHRPLSDPRSLVLHAPPGTVRLELEALHLPDEARLLVVAFERDTAAADRRLRTVLGADEERAHLLAERVGPWTWEELPVTWRDRMGTVRWRRVASVHQHTRPVRVRSGHRWLAMDDAAAPGTPVPPGGATAYNLEGPLVFEARWTGPDGQTARPTPTWLQIVGEGFAETRDLGRVESIGPLTFHDGIREVRIARDSGDEDGPVLLRAHTRADRRDRAWGDPPRLELDGDVQLVAPDFTGLFLWRTGPDAPLLFAIPAEHEVRVVARPRLEPGPLPALGPATPETPRSLRVTHLGVRTWTETLQVRALPSAYERYTQGDDPARARVSEETEWFLASSPEPWALLLESDQVIDVAVYIKERAAPSDVPEPGYPLEKLDASFRARYLPYSRRTWRARYPAGLDTLAAEGRAIRVDAQVRWAGRGSGGPSGLPYRVLELPPPFELVAEPYPGGSRTRLSAEPQEVVIPPNGRLSVDYKVPLARVGATVRVQLGEREEHPTLVAGAGSLRFEGLPPGPLPVGVEGPGLFLARAEGDRPWTVRRVWKLTPGQVRSIAVPAGGKGLSIHVARRADQDRGALAWRLNGPAVEEQPVAQRRREGRHPLQEETGRAEVLSRQERPWVWSPPLRLWFGDQLTRAATVELRLEARDEPVWIWVSSTWARPSRRSHERHGILPGVAR